MNNFLLLAAPALPIAAGIALYFVKRSQKKRNIFAMAAVLLTSAIVFAMIFSGAKPTVTLFHITPKIAIAFGLDGLSRFFAGMLALLWAPSTLYAFGYMKDEPRQNSFFCCYTAAFGVSLAIAESANIITLYCFIELLTLITVPLVMHPMTREARAAARLYLYMSITGSAFAFLGIVYLLGGGAESAFALGGTMTGALPLPKLRLASFVIFLGFGVKAAIFPLHIWLPRASVAPTPVTALLHAVAVVKAGVFAIMRLIYYCAGTAALSQSLFQYAAIGIAALTVVYGSAMALKEVHLKRRLAYSTVANLSYILVCALLMSQAALAAALTHMFCHAIIKLCAFFCAGNVLHETKREYIFELNGLGRKMPITFACFTIAACALTGIPCFCGFVSKWQICAAAADAGANGTIGLVAIIISAALTAGYMFSVVSRAYFFSGSEHNENVKEAPSTMLVPIIAAAALCVVLGLYASPLLRVTEAIASGAL